MKKNNNKYSGHFVPQQCTRAANSLCSDQNIVGNMTLISGPQLKGFPKRFVLHKSFIFVTIRLYIEFQCPTLPETGKKVCGIGDLNLFFCSYFMLNS